MLVLIYFNNICCQSILFKIYLRQIKTTTQTKEIKMEKLTAKKLIDSLDFSKEIDGIETSITKDHILFPENLFSWLSNSVSETWSADGKTVILEDEDGSDPWEMEKSEYEKLF